MQSYARRYLLVRLKGNLRISGLKCDQNLDKTLEQKVLAAHCEVT